MIIVEDRDTVVGARYVGDFDDYDADGKFVTHRNVPYVVLREVSKDDWLDCPRKRSIPRASRAELEQSLVHWPHARFYEISLD